MFGVYWSFIWRSLLVYWGVYRGLLGIFSGSIAYWTLFKKEMECILSVTIGRKITFPDYLEVASGHPTYN